MTVFCNGQGINLHPEVLKELGLRDGQMVRPDVAQHAIELNAVVMLSLGKSELASKGAGMPVIDEPDPFGQGLLSKDWALTPAERRRMTSGRKRKATAQRGHAHVPGTGPAGETCGSCAHIARLKMSRSYLKCALNRAIWTHGPGTDIRARDPACSKWEAPAEEPPCP